MYNRTINDRENNIFVRSSLAEIYISVLNMIRLPDCDLSGFCDSELDVDRTAFRKNSTRSDMDIQTALITAVKCLIRGFSGYKADWIKYLDRCTGLLNETFGLD